MLRANARIHQIKAILKLRANVGEAIPQILIRGSSLYGV